MIREFIYIDDSGNSTLPAEELGGHDDYEDDGIDCDAREALAQLDSATAGERAQLSPGETPRPVPKPRSAVSSGDLEQKEREISEVRRREEESAGGNGVGMVREGTMFMLTHLNVKKKAQQ